MTIKKSIYLVDVTINECQSLSEHGNINWSSSINAIAERYKLFYNYCLPALCEAEKNAIAQAYNGRVWHEKIDQEIKIMHWQIADAIEHDSSVRELLESDNVDANDFVERVKSFTNAERLAVIAFVNHFWAVEQ
jgi:hypothetical protein